MRRIGILLFLVSLYSIGFAQKKHPIAWEVDTLRVDADVFEIQIIAKINESWFLYSQDSSNVGMAMPTQIVFSENSNIELIGKAAEVGKNKNESSKYTEGVTFVQKVRLVSHEHTEVNLSIKYMACTKQMCLPPKTVRFSIML